ncbi:hypothetical protein RI367_005115 [Sorochytrium milnesiophthora]
MSRRVKNLSEMASTPTAVASEDTSFVVPAIATALLSALRLAWFFDAASASPPSAKRHTSKRVVTLKRSTVRRMHFVAHGMMLLADLLTAMFTLATMLITSLLTIVAVGSIHLAVSAASSAVVLPFQLVLWAAARVAPKHVAGYHYHNDQTQTRKPLTSVSKNATAKVDPDAYRESSLLHVERTGLIPRSAETF